MNSPARGGERLARFLWPPRASHQLDVGVSSQASPWRRQALISENLGTGACSSRPKGTWLGLKPVSFPAGLIRASGPHAPALPSTSCAWCNTHELDR